MQYPADFITLGMVLLSFAAIYFSIKFNGKRSKRKELEARKGIFAFLPAMYPDAALFDDHATFTHGQLSCRIEWHSFDNFDKHEERTTVSFQIPGWMGQELSKKGFSIDYFMPAQYIGALGPRPPKEYTDFLEGRLGDRVPSCPFVNAESENKALEKALQHDMKIFRILDEGNPMGQGFTPSFSLAEKRFYASVPIFIRSEREARCLISMAMALLRRTYMVACHVNHTPAVERKTIEDLFDPRDEFPEGIDEVAGDALGISDGEGGDAAGELPGARVEFQDDSDDAIVDEIERELAWEAAGNGGEEGDTLAIGDGER